MWKKVLVNLNSNHNFLLIYLNPKNQGSLIEQPHLDRLFHFF